MESISLEGLFGGLPFLDRSFRTDKFLTAVACARRHRHARTGASALDLTRYLQPTVALKVAGARIPGNPPSSGHAAQVEGALSQLVARRPIWRPLLQLPVVLRTHDSPKVLGYSSAARPQHFVLGPRAFTDEEELREQVLHEVAHIWLYMVQELWPLHHPTAQDTFVLPSGVGGKSATGVLDAAFVAAVLRQYYSHNRGRLERTAFLGRYMDECLVALRSAALTHFGLEVASRLRKVTALRRGTSRSGSYAHRPN